MTIHYQFAIIFVCSILLGCSNSKPDKAATAVQKVDENLDTIAANETRTYQDGAKQIRVHYKSEELLTVTRTSMTDTSRVLIKGVFQSDGVLGCDSCLFVRNKEGYNQTSGYMINDSLFLLTVAGTNWRILLYSINFNTQKVLQTDDNMSSDHLQTYLPAFIFFPKTHQIITSDRIEEQEEPSQSYKVVLYTYRIHDRIFSYQSQTTKIFPIEMRGNPVSMMYILRQLTYP